MEAATRSTPFWRAAYEDREPTDRPPLLLSMSVSLKEGTYSIVSTLGVENSRSTFGTRTQRYEEKSREKRSAFSASDR